MGGFVNRLLNRVSFKKPVWMNVLKVVGSLSLVLVGVLILTGRFITY